MNSRLTIEEAARLGLSITAQFMKAGPPPKPAVFEPTVTMANRLYTIGKRTMTLPQWCEEYKIAFATVTYRMRRGMPVRDALTTPLGRCGRKSKTLTFDGRTMTYTQWAEELGISLSTLSHRLASDNWTLERTLTEPVRTHKFTANKAAIGGQGV